MAPRRRDDLDAIARTRAVVREMVPAAATVMERETNQGLAGSIIDGVGRLTRRYGRAIVCEDDTDFFAARVGISEPGIGIVIEMSPRSCTWRRICFR